MLDFGAVGNGTDDDRPSIQAAIDFVENRGRGGARGGTVYLPGGRTYALSGPLESINWCSFQGDGTATRVVPLPAFPTGVSRNYNGANLLFDAPLLWIRQDGTARNDYLRDIFFDGDNIARIGVLISGTSHRHIQNIRLQSFVLDGIVFDGTQNSVAINLLTANCGRYGYRFINGCGWLTLVHVFSRANAGADVVLDPEDTKFPGSVLPPGVNLNRHINILFYGGLFEAGNATRDNVVRINDSLRTTFNHCVFFANCRDTYVYNAGVRSVFNDCTWQGSFENAAALTNEGAQCDLVGCMFQNFGSAGNSRDLIRNNLFKGLAVRRPFFSNINTTGKFIATLGTNDGLQTHYEDQIQSGPTGNRPDMSRIDAASFYLDLGGARRPLWYDPRSRVWRDATGAVQA